MMEFTLLCHTLHENYRYNFDPLIPHFYIVKLEFRRVYIIFLISAKKHRLLVLVRTAFVSENFQFFGGEMFNTFE